MERIFLIVTLQFDIVRLDTRDRALWLISSVAFSLISILILSMALSGGVYATASFVKTDKSEYVHGEPIIVFGNVGTLANNQTLQIELHHVSGEQVHVEENIPVSQNGSFTYSFSITASDKWSNRKI